MKNILAPVRGGIPMRACRSWHPFSMRYLVFSSMYAERKAAKSPFCKQASASDVANLLNAYRLKHFPLWQLTVTATEPLNIC